MQSEVMHNVSEHQLPQYYQLQLYLLQLKLFGHVIYAPLTSIYQNFWLIQVYAYIYRNIYVVHSISFQTFFVQTFKIIIDS